MIRMKRGVRNRRRAVMPLGLLVVMSLSTSFVARPMRAIARDDELEKLVDLLLEGEQVGEAAKLLAFDDWGQRTPREMRNLAEVARKHAERWRLRRLRYDGSVDLAERIRHHATTVLAKDATDLDAILAHAEACLAWGYEQRNRHAPGSFDDHFGPGIAGLLAAAARDDKERVTHSLRVVRLYRAESGEPDADRGDMLARAVALLASLREAAPDDRNVRAEAGMVASAHVRHLLETKQAGPAKAAFLEALALLAPQGSARPSESEAGAYNTLVELGLEAKLAPKGTTYLAETTLRGGFSIQFPLGTGWSGEGYPSFAFGESRIYSNWERATGGRVQLILESFKWDTNYAGVGGDNSKGIFEFLQREMSVRMVDAKAKATGAQGLPRWIKKPSGTRIEANGSDGQPMTWWLWVFKSKEHMLTYGLMIGVEGVKTKDLPGQAAFVLGSLVEPTR